MWTLPAERLKHGAFYGAPWLQPVAISGKSPNAANSKNKLNPLPRAATSCLRRHWQGGVSGSSPEEGFSLRRVRDVLRRLIVTSDDRQHVVAPSPAAMTALVALAQGNTVLVWDRADRTLIAANLRGTMPWTEDAATPGT